jgi:hypothetical protein
MTMPPDTDMATRPAIGIEVIGATGAKELTRR